MPRPYWKATPTGVDNPHILVQHEALHAAAIEILGGVWKAMVLRKKTGYIKEDRRQFSGWKMIATDLAPALIGDMSPSDEYNVSKGVSSRKRGYAWKWLQKNRDIIIERANVIATACGTPPGRLENRDGKLAWKGNG